MNRGQLRGRKYFCQDCKAWSFWDSNEVYHAAGIYCTACGSRALLAGELIPMAETKHPVRVRDFHRTREERRIANLKRAHALFEKKRAERVLKAANPSDPSKTVRRYVANARRRAPEKNPKYLQPAARPPGHYGGSRQSKLLSSGFVG